MLSISRKTRANWVDIQTNKLRTSQTISTNNKLHVRLPCFISEHPISLPLCLGFGWLHNSIAWCTTFLHNLLCWATVLHSSTTRLPPLLSPCPSSYIQDTSNMIFSPSFTSPAAHMPCTNKEHRSANCV